MKEKMTKQECAYAIGQAQGKLALIIDKYYFENYELILDVMEAEKILLNACWYFYQDGKDE